MGLIIQSARLALCKCGQHGVIAFGDGSKSEEFFSTKDALAEVETALLAKKVIAAEAEFLRKEIANSAILTEGEINRLREVASSLGHFEPAESEQAPQSPHTLH